MDTVILLIYTHRNGVCNFKILELNFTVSIRLDILQSAIVESVERNGNKPFDSKFDDMELTLHPPTIMLCSGLQRSILIQKTK